MNYLIWSIRVYKYHINIKMISIQNNLLKTLQHILGIKWSEKLKKLANFINYAHVIPTKPKQLLRLNI